MAGSQAQPSLKCTKEIIGFAIDHGASGAPVFDCEGQIAAVISTVITQVFQTPFGVLRTSTPWGVPNVVSVPAQKLMEFSEAQ